MHRTPQESRAAYTLVEVMIALAISVLVSGMAVWLIIDGTRLSLRTTATSINDLTQWGISNRLQLDSKVANGAVIYANFTATDIDASKRRTGGQRGNVLILSLSKTNDGDRHSHYVKITGYVFDPDEKTLSKFEHVVSAEQQASPPADLETILTSNLASFSLLPIAHNIESLDAAGPFVSRDAGDLNAATATFRVSQGVAATKTSDKAVFEVSFLIRK